MRSGQRQLRPLLSAAATLRPWLVARPRGRTIVFCPARRLASSWAERVSSFSPSSTSPTAPLSSSSIVERLQEEQQESNDAVVPWFMENMPPSYFTRVPPAAQVRHLRALSALYGSGVDNPEMQILSGQENDLTIIRRGEAIGLSREMSSSPSELQRLMDLVPSGKIIQRINKFTALDHTITLVNIRFDTPQRFNHASSAEELQARERILAHAQNSAIAADSETIDAFLAICPKNYVVRHQDLRRFFDQMRMYNSVKGKDGTATAVEPWVHELDDSGSTASVEPPTFANRYILTVCSENANPISQMAKISKYLGTEHDLTVRRVHLDLLGKDDSIMMLRCVVAAANGKELSSTAMQTLQDDVKRLRWVDDKVIDMATRTQFPEHRLPFGQAEIINAYSNMVHGPLSLVNRYSYTRSGIAEMLASPAVASHLPSIAELFLQRFDPNRPMDDSEFEDSATALRDAIVSKVVQEECQQLLVTMVDAVEATLKTNYYVEDRLALALRLEPDYMGVNEDIGNAVPYGTFFVHGRRFNAFHVRFRDIARGGLRVVLPPSDEAHALESGRAYREAYSLAFAQQLKNKDIPEGGSKAVCLVEPHGGPGSAAANQRLMRSSVKAFADAMLDLNTTDKAVNRKIVDHFGKPELVYLGPDENIVPEDIVWMTQRAALRGYPIPSAMISSKPDAGFNHKEYGVTSEGVNVFLRVALEEAGFSPTEKPFTVKITGGTNGDVAGNMLRFLNRDYGANAKVVGICDGTATAEDPDGLNMAELMRLVEEDLPISEYNPSLVSDKGTFTLADTPAGCAVRDSMHNRVQADVFVPAGGRPATINDSNWQAYLDDNGKASAPLVVEGANLFTTPAARQSLHDAAGVVFVKDSSANKCGVITSSYEILLSMLMDTDEFIGLKDALVPDILDRLRQLAAIEARQLFAEYRADPSTSLPEVSAKISDQITRVHDSVASRLSEMKHEDKESAGLHSVVLDHLPTAFIKHAGGDAAAWKAVSERVPVPYVDALIAAKLANRLVYQEGVAFVAGTGDQRLADLAFGYLRGQQQLSHLLEEVEAADLKNGNQVAEILRKAGARALVS